MSTFCEAAGETATAYCDWKSTHAMAAVLSSDPVIIYTKAGVDLKGNVAGIFGHRYPQIPATFLVSPKWSWELPIYPARIHADVSDIRRRSRRHRIIFLCNTPREAEMLNEVGETAIFCNQHVTVSEEIFRPLAGYAPTYDAVYNARLDPWKRHELAFQIPKVAYVTYFAGSLLKNPELAEARLRLVREHEPDHVVFNKIVNGVPIRLLPSQVNVVLNQAAVGLCLSAKEGAMYACIEYLLAGLPVVSTPSIGGRDIFFDPEYCLIVAPVAEAVRDGVAELRARNLPRDYVRKRTLDKIEPQRRRFLEILNEVLVAEGAEPFPLVGWPFHDSARLGRWVTLEDLASELRLPLPDSPDRKRS